MATWKIGGHCVSFRAREKKKKKKEDTYFSSTVSLQDCVSSGSVEMEHAYVYIEEIR